MCQQIDYSTILTVLEVVALCLKMFIYNKFKISFNQNNIFKNILETNENIYIYIYILVLGFTIFFKDISIIERMNKSIRKGKSRASY